MTYPGLGIFLILEDTQLIFQGQDGNGGLRGEVGDKVYF